MCMLSADKDGADRSRFENEAWTLSGDEYRHNSVPIAIEFPLDDDGIGRICVVRAVVGDLIEQDRIAEILNAMLKSKPLKQSDSQIWTVSTADGPRGIQFFTDKKSDQPQVRLIGAAF